MIPGVIAWSGGLLLVQCCPELPDEIARGALVLGALVGLMRRRWRPAGWLLAGCCWAVWRADVALDERLPPLAEGATFALSGVVEEIPVRSVSGVRFELRRAVSARGQSWPDGRQTIRLSTFMPDFAVAAGMECRLFARLRLPRGLRSPGAFDAERWAYSQGVDAVGYVIAHPENRCVPRAGFSLGRLRQSLAHAIDARIPAPATASILGALTVGARADMQPEQWQRLRDTGVVHLVSVSGLHVSMVALGVFAVARFATAAAAVAGRGIPDPRIPLACALLGAGGYALLAGFAVPTQRTLVMIAVALWNRLQGRPLVTWDSLAGTAAALLTVTPTAGLTLSFWLSFGALALLLLLGWLRQRPGWRYAWVDVHVGLAVLLSPLLAFAFQTVPPGSPFANIVAIPTVTLLVVPAALGAVAGIALGLPGADVLLAAAAWIWDGVWEFLGLVEQSLPAVRLPFRPTWGLLALSLGGLALSLSPFTVLRRFWLPALALLYVLPPHARLQSGEFEVAMLDVGQGLGVVVTTARHTLVYDTGARFRDGGDLGERVLVPYLRAHGIHHVDRLVVSHGDLDHAGGAVSLARALPIGHLLSSDTAVLDHVPAARRDRCEAGQRWHWDGVTFEMLSPRAALVATDNDRSCVLRIDGRSLAGASALLTGDISAATERTLLAARQHLRATALLVPHHGSATSSSPTFVAAVAPRFALISSGYGNRFNHPAPDVVMRYLAAGARVLSTADAGAVRVRFAAAAVAVHAERLAFRRYWDPPVRAVTAPAPFPRLTGSDNVSARRRATAPTREEWSDSVRNHQGGRLGHGADHARVHRGDRHHGRTLLVAAGEARDAGQPRRAGLAVAADRQAR